MNRIRTAVIGVGRWGRNLARNVREAADLELTVVCDCLADRLGNFDGVTCCTDPMAVFSSNQVEAVVIATPPETHAQLATAALQAGLHVLCEKPLAMSAHQCARLGESARSGGLRLMVDCTPVYLEEIRQAQAQLPWKAVTRVECRRITNPAGPASVGPLWDLAPHDLAVLRSWFGCLPQSGHGIADCNGFVRWEGAYANGPTVELEVGYGPAPERSIVVRTSDGRCWEFQQRQQSPEPLQSVLAHFAQCIRKRSEPLTGAAGALETSLLLAGVAS